MEKKQMSYQKVNPMLRWLMILSLGSIFLTLLISWLLWFFVFYKLIEEMLVNLTFITFSIFVLVFSGLSFLCFLALIFLTKKTICNNIFSLLSFVLSLAIGTISLIFYYKYLKIDNFLIIFLPLVITIIPTIFLLISSGLNLIFLNKENNLNIKIDQDLKENDLANKIDVTLLQDRNSSKKLTSNIAINESEKKVGNFSNIFATLNNFEENNEVELKETQKTRSIKIATPMKWTKKEISQIWEKATIIPGINKDLYRKDYAGAWMFFSDFIANPNSTILNIHSYSWTIAYYKPLSQEGANDNSNLIPTNVINAISKAESYPKWKTKISSRGNENIIKEQIWSD